MSDRAEQVTVDLGTRSYTVSISSGLFEEHGPGIAILSKLIRGKRVLLVCDPHVAPLYGDRILNAARLAGAFFVEMFVIPSGEKNKTFSTAEAICNEAVRTRLDRDSFILAAGGGITTDLAGFAASIYMRGISFISIPTSLLAMIDAGVGGKTGANLTGGKNLIGSFWQPKAVLMDVDFLRSLPDSERRCGAAELVKHAILFDPDFFSRLEETAASFLQFEDLQATARQIAWSSRLKAAVVSGDERESGRRALLNFGHTFGHAVEKLSEFAISHGEAVSIGMAMAASLSLSLKMIHEKEAARILSLIRTFGLPVRVSGLIPTAILEAMYSDKKVKAGKLHLILPRNIGRADIFSDIPEDKILEAIGEHCDRP